MFKNIDDDDCVSFFSIAGLRFEPNNFIPLHPGSGVFAQKLLSSPGPMISDFVTHEKGFNYSTYGIHVGQDDRLTFMGGDGTDIEGFFVDCREGSPTLHQIVRLRFRSALKRRLIIPRGVAHTFDGLDSVVTRDEPIWYADENNPVWNIDNDLISVSRSARLSEFPVVRANEHRLPDEAHVLLSKISQSLLEKPKSYLARFSVKIGGEDTFVKFEPKHWRDDENELTSIMAEVKIFGVIPQKNRYALTGRKSITLVPNTAACVADVVVFEPVLPGQERHFWHARTRKIYTFLDNESAEIELECIDLRASSATFGCRQSIKFTMDPRYSIRIEQGVAYKFSCSQKTLIRCEHEIFADRNEPRMDIPMFGNDLIPYVAGGPILSVRPPELRCPDILVYKMAKYEQEQIGHV